MKKQDIFMLFVTVVLVFLLVFPATSAPFFDFTDRFAVVGGFVKFFLFATFGDIVSHRIRFKHYRVPGLFYKAVVWGLIGIVIVFIFGIFSEGVAALQASGILPFAGSAFAFAFFTSLFMNAIFAPTMMLFHRMTDHYIEGKIANDTHTFNKTIHAVDYHGFVTFVVFKTIPLFWIPAHTITFLLPETYRVFFASLLGVVLGLILGLAKTRAPKEVA